MDDKTAEELAACIRYAEIIGRVLPVNNEMDRLVAQAMRRRSERTVGRKLTAKVKP